nr:hypothetical protein [Acidobacteriota bacterium]
MRRTNRRQLRAVFFAAAFVFLSGATMSGVRAQSSDANYPAPVFSKEVTGRIAPRDVGDPRRTRHFYTFRGTEGDLTITLDSTELIGDVDVFTATTLRPLLKFTLLGDTSHLTKSFYVRTEETLVLRVEARAAGDAEGSYRIQFGGSFEPAPADLANAPEPAEPTLKETGARDRNVRRVTSTGARVAEPTPQPTPAEEAARYVSLAYALGQPPGFDAPARTDDLPAGVLEVLDFAPLVREFYRRSGIDERLPEYARASREAGNRLSPATAEMVRAVLTYLHTRPQLTYVERVPASAPNQREKKKDAPARPVYLTREKERRFRVVPDPLAAPGAINF